MTMHALTIGLLSAFPWVLVGVIVLGGAAAAVRRRSAASDEGDECRPGAAEASPVGLPGPPRARRSPGVAAWAAGIGLAAGLAAGVVGAGPVQAASADGSTSTGSSTDKRLWALGIRWENDTFADEDRYYTNGIAAWLSHTGPSWADPVIGWLPWGDGRRTVTYGLSQAMFTPQDTDRNPPDPADRPYAGVLTFDLGLHVDRDNRYHGLKLILGVAGPWSGAEQAQNEVHRKINSKEAQGWDSQLHNEPVLDLAYEHRRRYRLAGTAEGWSAEVIPIAGFALGNLLTQGQLGGQVRVGYKIPDDFGGSLLRGISELPPPRYPESGGSTLGFYVHGGIGGTLVLHDLTLDGNTFKDSPSVDKKYFVPLAGFGVGVGNRHFLATFVYVYMGEEFEGQQSHSRFGAFTLSYFF